MCVGVFTANIYHCVVEPQKSAEEKGPPVRGRPHVFPGEQQRDQ